MQLYNQDAAAVRLCKRSGNDPGAGLATALVFSCRLGRSSVRICPEAPFKAAAALARRCRGAVDAAHADCAVLALGRLQALKLELKSCYASSRSRVVR